MLKALTTFACWLQTLLLLCSARVFNLTLNRVVIIIIIIIRGEQHSGRWVFQFHHTLKLSERYAGVTVCVQLRETERFMHCCVKLNTGKLKPGADMVSAPL